MIVAAAIQFERLLRLESVGALLHDAGADDLHVDAGCIHLVDPQRQFGHPLEQRLGHAAIYRHPSRVLRALEGPFHHLRHEEMGMHVDDDRLWRTTPRTLCRAPPRLMRVGAGTPAGWAGSLLAPFDCCRHSRLQRLLRHGVMGRAVARTANYGWATSVE